VNQTMNSERLMSEPVKVALIIACTVLASVGIWIYFSPYQTCVRARSEALQELNTMPLLSAQVSCRLTSEG
jgi:hypothetical protein